MGSRAGSTTDTEQKSGMWDFTCILFVANVFQPPELLDSILIGWKELETELFPSESAEKDTDRPTLEAMQSV